MTPSLIQNSLETDPLLIAYRTGYFPMADPKSGVISWYSPDPRAIIPLESFHIPHSLRKLIKQGIFEIRFNTAFEMVIRGCADRGDTWISPEIIRAYTSLNSLGHAHSVEAWQRGDLVGGLYGVSIGGAFFGESMFSYVPNASKVALVHLVKRLLERHFLLLDSQIINEHMKQFGAIEIPRSEYLAVLSKAVRLESTFD
jgi:leucyl/phenylalanyl-tRNA--protein transferase